MGSMDQMRAQKAEIEALREAGSASAADDNGSGWAGRKTTLKIICLRLKLSLFSNPFVHLAFQLSNHVNFIGERYDKTQYAHTSNY